MKKWKVLSSKYLFKRPWLTVRRDVLELPDNRINDEYYVLEYPTWVNVIAVTTDGKFVMVEQYRHGLRDIFKEIVAGVSEAGESPLEAAKRELLEETGFAGGQWREHTVLCANPGSQNNLTYSFVAEGVEKIEEQHLDATEDVRVLIVEEQEVRRMLVEDEIKQALMAAPLWKYFSEKDSK